MSQESTNRSFDELARGLAEGSISRRRALKLFAGTAIAALIPSTRAMAAVPCPPGTVKICHVPQRADGTCRRGAAETRCVTPAQAAATRATLATAVGDAVGPTIVVSRGLGRASRRALPRPRRALPRPRRRLGAYRMTRDAPPTLSAVATTATLASVVLETASNAPVRTAALPRAGRSTARTPLR